jgi:hypothetical protein
VRLRNPEKFAPYRRSPPTVAQAFQDSFWICHSNLHKTEIARCADDKLGRLGLRFGPDTAELTQENVGRHRADARTEIHDPLLQIGGVASCALERMKIAAVPVNNGLANAQDLGCGFLIVAHVTATIQNIDHPSPACLQGRFRVYEPSVRELEISVPCNPTRYRRAKQDGGEQPPEGLRGFSGLEPDAERCGKSSSNLCGERP